MEVDDVAKSVTHSLPAHTPFFVRSSLVSESSLRSLKRTSGDRELDDVRLQSLRRPASFPILSLTSSSHQAAGPSSLSPMTGATAAMSLGGGGQAHSNSPHPGSSLRSPPSSSKPPSSMSSSSLSSHNFVMGGGPPPPASPTFYHAGFGTAAGTGSGPAAGSSMPAQPSSSSSSSSSSLPVRGIDRRLREYGSASAGSSSGCSADWADGSLTSTIPDMDGPFPSNAAAGTIGLGVGMPPFGTGGLGVARQNSMPSGGGITAVGGAHYGQSQQQQHHQQHPQHSLHYGSSSEGEWFLCALS